MSAVEAAPLMCAGITTYNALRNSGAQPGEVVAVTLESLVTETGMLELWFVANDARRWKLEFNVRDPLKRRWPKEIDAVSARDVREGTGGPGRRTRPLG